MQASPLFLKSALLAPFRELLAPLAHWLMGPHVFLPGEEIDSAPVNVPLRKPGLLTIVLGLIVGPLVFVMLLPLILILVPAVIIMGFVGVLIASLGVDHQGSVRAASAT